MKVNYWMRMSKAKARKCKAKGTKRAKAANAAYTKAVAAYRKSALKNGKSKSETAEIIEKMNNRPCPVVPMKKRKRKAS